MESLSTVTIYNWINGRQRRVEADATEYRGGQAQQAADKGYGKKGGSGGGKVAQAGIDQGGCAGFGGRRHNWS